MHRTQLLLEEWQYEAPKSRAEREGRSLSGMVREALVEYLVEEPETAVGRLQSLAGLASDPETSGRDHDRVLYGDSPKKGVRVERLFVDTSAWYAYVNRADPEHSGVEETLASFEGRLITTNFVFNETVTLCLYRLGHDIALKVGEALLDSKLVDLIRTSPREEAAWELFAARADKRYSYTDCTSIVLLRRLGLTRVLALDEDFRQEGFETSA